MTLHVAFWMGFLLLPASSWRLGCDCVVWCKRGDDWVDIRDGLHVIDSSCEEFWQIFGLALVRLVSWAGMGQGRDERLRKWGAGGRGTRQTW